VGDDEEDEEDADADRVELMSSASSVDGVVGRLPAPTIIYTGW